jgi:transcription elongation GreA/GreB family factor
MTKQKLLQHVVEALTQERRNTERSLEAARSAAIEAPGAMQSHSDTTKSQMSRLSEEMQRSIDEKDLALRALNALMYSGLPSNVEAVKVGSVVEVRDGRNERAIYFILPAGGGIKVVDGDRTILVVTPRAPLSVALLGKRRGETVKLQIGPRHRELTVVDIQ